LIFKLGPTSANTGVAPVVITAPAAATKEFGGRITSSPEPIPSTLKANVIASAPDETAIA